MTVQFILGRSGTGKTHHCVTAIVDALVQKDSTPLVLLVPEQATYQAQRAILNDPRIAGYNRLQVLSFDRLVYLASGKNTTRPAISRLGRAMVIQRILRDCASRLTIFGNSPNPGLGKRLSDTITQLQQYANGPDDIKNLVGKLKKQSNAGLSAAKFADIAIIFEEYLKFIEGRFLDPDIQLASACKAVDKADFVRGAQLWVDGFAGFTAGELALLTELLKVVKDAQIALCLDPAAVNLADPDKTPIDPADLFGPTIQTYVELVERVKKCKLKLSPPLILDKPKRFSQNPSLAHIERNIFTHKPAVIAAGNDIRIVSAPSARAEAQFVASEIAKLVRYKGYRYRDIAVIASDIDSYENYIKAGFEDFKIPVFIDKRRPLNQHPVIQLICSCLNAVANDFPANEIFAYLKTDLAGVERADIDLLENYCIAFGITSSDWKTDKPWLYAGPRESESFKEQQVDQIRRKAIAPLLQLSKKLADAVDPQGLLAPEQFTKIIFALLETIEVRKRLASWVEQSLKQGDFAAADEHRQLYDRLVDVFDELVEAFSGCSFRGEDYLAIITSAFSQITLAFIPPNLDGVLVGSIERSRHPDLKAVFLIGTTERQFPSPIVFDNILSEDDRLAAQSSGLAMPPGVRQELANRQYLAYIAFTRPSELLYITYPAVDQKSNAVVRSSFVDNLCQLFDGLEEQSSLSSVALAKSDEPAPSSVDEVCTAYDLEEMLCCRLGKQSLPQTDEQQLDGLLQELLKDEQLSTLGKRVSGAINYENKATLDDSIVRHIFGQNISSSASRLSAFAECPYRHFARYILGLKKRDEFKLEPLDVGDFYHRVLDAFLKRVVADKVDFKTIAPAALMKLVDEEVEKLCRDDPFISKFTTHSPHNAFIINNAVDYLRDCVVAVSQMICAGSFRPILSEISFGRSKQSGDSIGEFKIALDDGRYLSLNGRIDRLDVAKIDGRKVALVFDYKKRSKGSFSWAQFYHGLDIQLAVYMLALLKSADGPKIADCVAGAFYLPIEVSPDDTPISKLAENRPKFPHKARGIFNGRYVALLDNSASKESRFYSFYFKDGEPYGYYGTRDAVKPDDFDMFLKFSENKIISTAGGIISGRIDVKPYRLSGKSPCANCEYKPVCRFDWQINDYNLLAHANKKDVIARITNTDEPEKS